MVRERLRPEAIRGFREEGGWPWQPIAEDAFRSVFSARKASFSFCVRVDAAGFMVVATVPSQRGPVDEAGAAVLYRRLLARNHELRMAKFSIDGGLDGVLSVESALPDLDKSELMAAPDTLFYDADRPDAELRGLARGAARQKP
jgi:hypothetical protein